MFCEKTRRLRHAGASNLEPNALPSAAAAKLRTVAALAVRYTKNSNGPKLTSAASGSLTPSRREDTQDIGVSTLL